MLVPTEPEQAYRIRVTFPKAPSYESNVMDWTTHPELGNVRVDGGFEQRTVRVYRDGRVRIGTGRGVPQP